MNAKLIKINTSAVKCFHCGYDIPYPQNVFCYKCWAAMSNTEKETFLLAIGEDMLRGII